MNEKSNSKDQVADKDRALPFRSKLKMEVKRRAKIKKLKSN